MMDLSQQLHALASDVGNDYAMSAPEDAASLIGKARRGRMVWTSGVGAVAAAGAATLVFGAPAVAAVLTGDAQLEPASPATESESATPSPSVSPSPEPSPSPSPSVTPSPGAIDLTGGAGLDDDDDDAYDDDSYEDDDDAYDDHDDDDDDDSSDDDDDDDSSDDDDDDSSDDDDHDDD
jgi:hypothetical protein